MSVSRFFYEPFFNASDFDRLIDDALSTRNPQRASEGSATIKFLKPKMDVHENPEGNTVTASFELPGLKKEDVNIDVQQGRLTVSGESTDSSERAEHGFAIRERRFGRFSRTIQLPEGIKQDEIKASMDHGLLNVTFPKSAPQVAPKKINID
jgi:HSP20 family protein